MKTLLTTIALTLVASSSFACSGWEKFTHGGLCKEEWTEREVSRAEAEMERTGKSVVVQGNFVYVGAAGTTTQIAKNDLRGKRGEALTAFIIEAVKDHIKTEAIEELGLDEDISDEDLQVAVETAAADAGIAKEDIGAAITAGVNFDEEAARLESLSNSIKELENESGGTFDELTNELKFDNPTAANDHFNETCGNGGCFDANGNEITSLPGGTAGN